MKRTITFATGALLATLFLATCASAADPIKAHGSVDLPRYMGRWYVIASIPTRFERGGHNEAETYRLNADGTVCTWFRLRPDRFSAPVKLLRSAARVMPGRGNGEWQARFPYFRNPQYLIGWLKPDYSQVLVVRNRRDYFWYMARTPQVSSADYQEMLDRAEAMGYRAARIEKMPQRWPESGEDSESFTGECA